MVAKRWRASRFNLSAREPDGTLLIFNSFSGAFIELRDDLADRCAELLATGESVEVGEPGMDALAGQGVLVPEFSDELRRADSLHQTLLDRRDRLSLTLMPTEKCNFRCVYCYESFAKGRMRPEVISSIVRFVEREAPRLRTLNVAWFGGEPLIALDVVSTLSAGLIEVCEAHDVRYGSGMTTNGYLLSGDRVDRCFEARIRRFQITLDGPPETHNRLRVKAGGGDTYEAIVANLRELRSRPDEFHVRLRVNYTPDVVAALPGFLKTLGTEFADDGRFTVQCHAVGRWGGPHDHLLETCDANTVEDVSLRFMTMSTEAGFELEGWREFMRPYGSVCYAADPRAFVIGSDGTVYKCTVAFDDPRNHVGKVTADGDLGLVEELHDLWTTSGEERDPGCQACAYRPACQGNFCPLERLQGHGKVCPTVKRHPDKILPLIAAGARRARP